MSQSPSDPPRKTPQKPENGDRRAPRGTPGSMRWVKGLLGRPLALERRGSQLHLTLVDRRRPPELIQAHELESLRTELRARLLAHEDDSTATVMRHLVFVHDVLGGQGWAGVEAMASRVLGKALVQAQMLASEEASPRLTHLIDRLQVLKAAASVREEKGPAPAAPEAAPEFRRTVDMDTRVEVSEGSAEDFDAIERSWEDTVSQKLTATPVTDS